MLERKDNILETKMKCWCDKHGKLFLWNKENHVAPRCSQHSPGLNEMVMYEIREISQEEYASWVIINQ
jgi:Zn finger protein HypA/HybF involved in hydrogenase expression